MKKLKDIINRYPALRILANRYVLVLLFFAIWMLFLDNYSYLDHRVLNKEIDELENNIEYYKKEISQDSVKIKKLENTDEIEKYAREKYYMKKQNEDVYIIEFEENKTEE